jgi:hypothetical protein
MEGFYDVVYVSGWVLWISIIIGNGGNADGSNGGNNDGSNGGNTDRH